jgi:anti-sigma regulatory factor (Ser/Thr protein kinase)
MATLTPRTAPARLSLPATEGAAREARRFVVRTMRALGASPATCERAALATSEAATNAIIHAFPCEPGTVDVRVEGSGDRILVVVADDGQGMVMRSDSPGLGMGLGLMARASEEMDVVPGSPRGTELRMWFRQ